MAYEIEIQPHAARQIRKLPRHAQAQVNAKIDALANNPRPSGVVKLTAGGGLYRVKTGAYRIQYLIEDARLVVIIVKVSDRRDAY